MVILFIAELFFWSHFTIPSGLGWRKGGAYLLSVAVINFAVLQTKAAINYSLVCRLLPRSPGLNQVITSDWRLSDARIRSRSAIAKVNELDKWTTQWIRTIRPSSKINLYKIQRLIDMAPRTLRTRRSYSDIKVFTYTKTTIPCFKDSFIGSCCCGPLDPPDCSNNT